MADNNKKYGRLVTDEAFLRSIAQDAQDAATGLMGNPDVSEELAKECVANWLVGRQIEPEDMDDIMAKLVF